MSPQNPVQHARVAADALERLVQDVRSGRAEWCHPTNVRQGTDDLIRLCEAMATTVQQLAAALTELGMTPPGPVVGPARQTMSALHLAGQSATTAAQNLRRARRTMR